MINFNAIQEHFKSFIRFNNDFLKYLSLKINNLCVFSKIISKKLNSYIEINNILKSLKESNFNVSENQIKKYLAKDDYQTIQMLKSLGTTWYRCPNGNFYVVGECGGPMQSAICPECHERIGGQLHIPNQGNQRVEVEQMFREFNNNRYDEQ